MGIDYYAHLGWGRSTRRYSPRLTVAELRERFPEFQNTDGPIAMRYVEPVDFR